MAVQAKLDELILNTAGAENKLAVAEDLSDEQLEGLTEEFRRVARRGGTEATDRNGGKNGQRARWRSRKAAGAG